MSLLVICAAVFAQNDSTDNRTTKLRFVEDATTLGKKHFSVSFCADFATGYDYVIGYGGVTKVRRTSDGDSLSPGTSKLLSGITRLSYGLTGKTDIGLEFPFFGDLTGWGASQWGVDDITLYLRQVLKPVSEESVLSLTGVLGLTVPTGNPEMHFFPRNIWNLYNSGKRIWHDTERDSIYEGNFYVNPELVFSLDLKRIRRGIPLRIHINSGAVITNNKESMTALLGLAFSGTIKNRVQLSLEIASQTRPFVPSRNITDAITTDPIRIIPSVAVTLPHGLDLLIAVQAGLANGKDSLRFNLSQNGYLYSTKTVPFYGASLTLTYNGVIRRSGNPGTGVSPGKIRRNRFDFDLDSIPDSVDACKKTPEDRDGFEDSDGCPEYDNDKDGVVDESDGCPDNAEDKDGFEDADGCPDFDNDADGIPDSLDACPDINGVEKYRGCSDKDIVTFTRTVLSEIDFEVGTSKIAAGTEILDKVYTAMSRNPKMAIEIQVHTDNRGSALENSELSQNRADVIKLYLVSKGIRPNKIKALGLGSEFPVADNSTEEGRLKNMRVEVRRTD